MMNTERLEIFLKNHGKLSGRGFYLILTFLMLGGSGILALIFPNILDLPMHPTAEGTDVPVFWVALLTLILAALTLLVSWYIKQEAEEIGKNIADTAREIGESVILSLAVKSYLDGVVRDYSRALEHFSPNNESIAWDGDRVAKEIQFVSTEILIHTLKTFNGSFKGVTQVVEKFMPGKIGADFRRQTNSELFFKILEDCGPVVEAYAQESFEIQVLENSGCFDIARKEKYGNLYENNPEFMRKTYAFNGALYRLMRVLGCELNLLMEIILRIEPPEEYFK